MPLPILDKAYNQYGASMGRATYNEYPIGVPFKARLWKEPIDSYGYDRGGAYWGHGEALYFASDYHGKFFHAVRATNREQAAKEICKHHSNPIKFKGIE